MFRRRQQTDEAIVQAVLAGRIDQFEVLVERYLSAVLALAHGRVGPSVDVEDVGQETFLKAFRSLPSLREPAKFKYWVLGIARNTALRHAERAQREAKARAEAGKDTTVETPSVEHDELKLILRREVEALEETSRDVLLLYYYGGKNATEIADLLEITPEAVRKRMQRAREALGERMLTVLGGDAPNREDVDRNRDRIVRAIAAAPVPWAAGSTSASAAVTSAAAKSAWSAWLWPVGIPIVLAMGAGLGVYEITREAPSPPPAAVDMASAAEANAEETEPPPAEPRAEPSAPPEPAFEEEILDHPFAFHPPLPPGAGMIQGRLYDEHGVSVPDAEIVAFHTLTWDHGPDVEGIRTARSNAQGEFTLRQLPADRGRSPARYLVLAYTDTAVAVREAYVSTHSFHPRVARMRISMRPRAEISGRVVDHAGAPVAGAIVSPMSVTQLVQREQRHGNFTAPPLYTKSAADGRFTLPCLWEDTWHLSTLADGYYTRVHQDIRAGSDAVEIVLGQGPALNGQVIDKATGEGVPNIPLRIGHDGARRYIDPVRSVRTDEHGRFSLQGMLPGAYMIGTHESPENYLGSTSEIVPTGAAQGEFVFALVEAVRGGTISGVVRSSATGAPVARAEVMATMKDNETAWRHATADASGRFTMNALMPGDYFLSVRYAPGMKVAADIAAVTIDEGDAVEDLELLLDPQTEYVLRGRVETNQGRPLNDALVGALGPDPMSIVSLRSRTSADGRFAIYADGPVSPLYLRASVYDWAMQPVGPFHIESENPGEIVLTMEPGATIRGHLYGPDNKPLAEQAIYVNELEYRQRPGLNSWFNQSGSETLGDGSFELTEVPEGDWRVGVQYWDLPAELASLVQEPLPPVSVKAGDIVEGVELRLMRLGHLRIAGRVVDESGAPVHGASVSNVRPIVQVPNWNYQLSSRTDEDGWFEIVNLPAGDYHVYAHHSEYAPTGRIQVAAGDANVVITLQTKPEIAGQVLDAETGRPVTGFRIGEGDTTVTARNWKQVNDPDGRFQFTSDFLHQSGALIQAEGYEYAHIAPASVASASEAKNLKVYLQRALEAHGIVTDIHGNPIQDATVFVGYVPTDPERQRLRQLGVTDENGRFEITLPVPLAERLSAQHPAYSPGWTYFGGDNHIVLEQPGRIEGRVTVGGRPLAGIPVASGPWHSGWQHYQATTDEDGAYQLNDVPVDEHVITVRTPHGSQSPNFLGQIERRAMVESGAATIVDFDFPAATGILTGTVTVGGRAPNSFSVTIEDAATGFRTGSGGNQGANSFRIENVPAGSVTVRVEAMYANQRERRHRHTFDQYIAANRENHLDIDIPIGDGTIVIDLTGVDPDHVTTFRVLEGYWPHDQPNMRIYDEMLQRTVFTATPNVDTTFTVSKLPPGEYTVGIGMYHNEVYWFGSRQSTMELGRYQNRYLTVNDGDEISLSLAPP